MELKFKVKPPMMPNFFFMEEPTGKREDGFKPAEGTDIVKFTDEQAEQFGELMKQSFIEHYKKRKYGK